MTRENISNLLTMMLQKTWNFQMNKNESFYFRTEVRKQKWCVPTPSVPPPKLPLPPADSEELAFRPWFPLQPSPLVSCTQEIALLAPAVCTAADSALSWELWLLCHLSGPRALPWEYASPFLPELSTPFPSPAPSPPATHTKACCTHGIQCFLSKVQD